MDRKTAEFRVSAHIGKWVEARHSRGRIRGHLRKTDLEGYVQVRNKSANFHFTYSEVHEVHYGGKDLVIYLTI